MPSPSRCWTPGQVRVSVNYNHPWRGFTLQKGHFYGTTDNMTYFVTALENHGSLVKFYISRQPEHWETVYIPRNSALVRAVLRQVKTRKEKGMTAVTKQPLDKMPIGKTPKMRQTGTFTPMPSMYIAGGQRKTKPVTKTVKSTYLDAVNF